MLFVRLEPSNERRTMTDNHKQLATGRTEVRAYVSTTFDEETDGPPLLEVHLTETFVGDIEGEGTGRVIQAVRKGKSVTFAGIERVRGSLANRKGTFLLRVSGMVVGKDMNADWVVVPESGTGELRGLRGDGGFKAVLGQHGSVWLEYFFA
ncbi:MAG TPA: DUF3224 domain-containing protein [Polyangiaceae bacterium]|nr:DUF3224 domain-containing protein [Polyangiaceae bacterium]